MKLSVLSEATTSGIWEFYDELQEEVVFKLEHALRNAFGDKVKVAEAPQGEIIPSRYYTIYLFLAKVKFISKHNNQYEYNIALTGGKLNEFAIHGDSKEYKTIQDLIDGLINKINRLI